MAPPVARDRPDPRFADRPDDEADRWLVERVARGHPEAFEVLLRRHQERIHRIALRMLGDPQDAEDVAQDVALQLWRALAAFSGSSTFSTWLYRLVVNRCLDHRRPGAATGRQAGVADDAGSYVVVERAVVSVAGHAARTTPGVRTALGLLGGPGGRGGRSAHVGISGGSVAIEVVVAADYGRDLHRLAGEVRRRVHDAVRALLGPEAVEIAVEIDDVLVPRD